MQQQNQCYQFPKDCNALANERTSVYLELGRYIWAHSTVLHVITTQDYYNYTHTDCSQNKKAPLIMHSILQLSLEISP